MRISPDDAFFMHRVQTLLTASVDVNDPKNFDAIALTGIGASLLLTLRDAGATDFVEWTPERLVEFFFEEIPEAAEEALESA